MLKKWLVILSVVMIFAFGTMALIQIVDEGNQIEEVDGMVYTFIVGKVEGNDDLLSGLLTEKAKGIIVPGRHAFPGAAEEMGERYSIKRYVHAFVDGVLIYEVAFYRPPTDTIDYYTVVVLNEDDGWKIAKNSSVDSIWVEQQKLDNTPEVIHAYGGVEK